MAISPTNSAVNRRSERQTTRRNWWPWLAIVAISTTLATVLAQKLLFQLDGRLYDSGIAAAEQRPQPSDDIAIIGLDEKFIAGRPVGLMPRDKLATLISKLAAMKPAVIVLDVWLDSRFDLTEKGHDAQLRQALMFARKSGVPVLLPQVALNAEEGITVTPIPRSGLTAQGATLPYFADAAGGTGGVDFSPDPDGIYRNLPAINPARPSMQYLAATLLRKQQAKNLPAEVLSRLQREDTPIDFRAGPGQLQITPFATIEKELKPDAFPIVLSLMEGKLVFIGATFPRSGDFFVTPFQSLIEGKVLSPKSTMARRQMYGVELLAHATDTILRGAPRHSPQSVPARLHVLIATLLVAALVGAAALRGAVWGIGAAVAACGGALWVAMQSSSQPGALWLWHAWPVSPFLAAAILASGLGIGYRQLQEARELRMVKEVFGGYVGDEVLQKLGGKMPEMGGETEEIAVLFCDIAGFSALAEGMRDDPAKLLRTLNGHFEPLVLTLQDRGAYVDNYVGDLIMALFGAPVSAGSPALNARNAVLAAVDFVRIVAERNAARRAAGEPVIEVGIGVHCGPAVVGNLGSQRRMKYTAIGDTVNIASRVESSTRKFDTHLLVTEEIVKACENDPEIVALGWEFAAETQVKGRVAPVRLYRCKAAS